MLCNNRGEVLFKFSKHVGVKDSNEAEVFAIRSIHNVDPHGPLK